MNRDLLFSIQRRFGCHPVTISLLEAQHSGNSAVVRVHTSSQPTGEPKSEAPERSAQFMYRCDGGAFNLQRLRSSRKTKLMTGQDMQYADKAALVAGSAVELQEQLSASGCAVLKGGPYDERRQNRSNA